jgi:hypothetical protein
MQVNAHTLKGQPIAAYLAEVGYNLNFGDKQPEADVEKWVVEKDTVVVITVFPRRALHTRTIVHWDIGRAMDLAILAANELLGNKH